MFSPMAMIPKMAMNVTVVSSGNGRGTTLRANGAKICW